MNVDRILEERRLRAEETRNRLLEEIRAKAPAFEENETQIREIGFALIRAAMHGTDASELSREMEDAKKRRLEILKDAGYGETVLIPPYTCPMCGDTGIRDGKICDCKRALILASRFHDHELSRKLEVENFDAYDLSLYEDGGVGSPRDHARTARDKLYRFAERYPESTGENYYLFGPVGTGKTFLLHAVTKALIEKRVPVVYQSAYELVENIKDATFSYDRAEESDAKKILEAPVLLIDDLGTEILNGLTISMLFEVISVRGRFGRTTMISTNLSPNELEARYTPRIASRILGGYRLMPLTGRDLRL